MKKKLTILLFTALMMLMLTVPVAASYRTMVLSSTSGKWITQKEETYNDNTGNGRWYVYKVVVPATGYLKIETSGTNSSRYVRISRDVPKEDNDYDEEIYDGMKYGVDKGAVYLWMYYSGDKFRYTFKAAPVGSNYNRTRAASLAKNLHKYIAMTPNYYFSRWYKIKLTKKQRLQIVERGGLEFRTYDSKGNDISLSKYTYESGNRYASGSALPVGTYYIVVLKGHTYSDEVEVNYYWGGDFYWK